jgi:catechol 2,3-dioxygenase-like lactoylglutathione lyase family enzyme
MRSHLSLNVRDVPRSVAFYQRVFGVAPQKQTSTYAKFDLEQPALNFSLNAGAEPSRVSHLGIEALSAEEFAALHERLTAAGIELKAEQGSRCCFALQDKLWFSDPDGITWEVFQVHEQLPVSEANERGTCCPPAARSESGARTQQAGGCCG